MVQVCQYFDGLGLLLLVEFRIRHQVLSTLGFVSWFAVCFFAFVSFDTFFSLASRVSFQGSGLGFAILLVI